MPGFSNITGDESIMYADNCSFDGTERDGKMTANGQLWIGSASSPHVRKATLTNGNNISFTNGPGSIIGNLTGTTDHAVQVGNTTGSLTSVGPSAIAGQVFQSGGPLADPSYSTATYPSTAGTSGTLLQSNGTNIVNTTATYPGTATGTGKILRADGTNWVATTATYPDTAGTSGNVLTSDGTNWVSSTPGNTAATAGAVLEMVDDFYGYKTGANLNSVYSWQQSNLTQQGDANRPGIYRNTAGTCGLILGEVGASGFIVGGGEITLQWYAKLGILSDATNGYVCRIGFGTAVTGSVTNGMYFQYSHISNSGNWQLENGQASSYTTVNTTTAADTNWHIFKIVINAAGTSVAFYIDGVEVTNSPLTTKIPTLAVSPYFSCTGFVGTVQASTMFVDLFTLRQVLTTSRG